MLWKVLAIEIDKIKLLIVYGEKGLVGHLRDVASNG